MVYLIGGTCRSGKSTLAKLLLKQHGIPYFGLDQLMMGLYRGAPELGVSPDEKPSVVAEKMWPICKGMITSTIYAMHIQEGRYCIEGDTITPENVSLIY